MSNRNWPLGLLIFGICIIFLAVVYTCIGRISDHRFGWIERARDPIGYWFLIALCYLSGLGFVGFYLYKIHAFSK